MPCSKIVGIVLAGGASQRMGQDKALLRWREGTLLDRAQYILKPLCAEVFVSGSAQGIADSSCHGGPVLALQSVVADPRINAFDAMLICAVDTPLLLPDDLSLLIAALSQHDAAHFQQHYLPCALRLTLASRAAIKRIAEMPQASQRSMRHLMQELKATDIGASGAQQQRLINLNTPQLYHYYFQQEINAS